MQDIWRAARLPSPPAGFSCNSVFLNIHYLVACTRRKELSITLKRSFPWLLCHIWKARNSLIFEKIRLSPESIVSKADEDCKIWFEVNFPTQDEPTGLLVNTPSIPAWYAPPSGMLKCKIGASWISGSVNCGASWIIRDSQGKVTLHRRRSFSAIQSRDEAELHALLWAVDSACSLKLDNIIFESSFPMARASLQRRSSPISQDIVSKLQQMRSWSLDHVQPARNSLALKIADSIISGSRYQSYVACDGPRWLHREIAEEA